MEDLNLADGFTEELAKGMAALMREIAAESDVGGGGLGDAEGKTGPQTDQEKAFREAWEKMLIEGMNESLEPGFGEETEKDNSKGKDKGKEAGKAESGEGKEDAFQESIRKAMNKLKESETNLQVHCIDISRVSTSAKSIPRVMFVLGRVSFGRHRSSGSLPLAIR